MAGDEKFAAAAGGDMDSLTKHNEKLLAFVNDISSRFAALNFKAYEMAEDIRKALRELVAAYRSEMDARGQVPEGEKK
jgi:hypothetical protein